MLWGFAGVASCAIAVGQSNSPMGIYLTSPSETTAANTVQATITLFELFRNFIACSVISRTAFTVACRSAKQGNPAERRLTEPPSKANACNVYRREGFADRKDNHCNRVSLVEQHYFAPNRRTTGERGYTFRNRSRLPPTDPAWVAACSPPTCRPRSGRRDASRRCAAPFCRPR